MTFRRQIFIQIGLEAWKYANGGLWNEILNCLDHIKTTQNKDFYQDGCTETLIYNIPHLIEIANIKFLHLVTSFASKQVLKNDGELDVLMWAFLSICTT